MWRCNMWAKSRPSGLNTRRTDSCQGRHLAGGGARLKTQIPGVERIEKPTCRPFGRSNTRHAKPDVYEPEEDI
jgi:hypothetical protein